MQLVIMMTPVRVFFKVKQQNWQEWLFAIGTGAASMPLAFITKLIAKPLQQRFGPVFHRKKSIVHPEPQETELTSVELAT